MPTFGWACSPKSPMIDREAGSINRPFSINQAFVSLKMGVPSHVKFQGTGNSDYNNTDDKIAKQESDGDDLVA